ncbi:cobalamin-binding protein [Ktedonospora formicarum]|uniref:Cobalamin-binding protein n=1 Tax=Ktedonospora formicarum TaxID=2778364 RepID=A0A8J3MXV5_9CHLR|nr:cobalamin-binding protein [Ktedonospora formicarum]GHO50113.1 cobalamin-binding protein [Ktedonospora formicarum]
MRVVSLLASATEIIAELDCLDQLVGRSHECDYPTQVRQLPLVSHAVIDTQTSSEQIDAQVKQHAQARNNNALNALSIYTIDTYQLQLLQPDIIFTQTQCEVCAVSEQDVAIALEQTIGLSPRIVSLAPYRLQDVWEDVFRVGRALEKLPQAQELVQRYQQRLQQLQEQTTVLAIQQNKPRVLILEWLDPLMGAGNWTPELITYAGGENIYGENGERSPWLTWEQLAELNPDFLLLAPCGFSLERTLQDIPILTKHPHWSALKAVRNGHVYAIDGNYYLNRSGPRLVESAEIIAHILWGERLSITTTGWQPIVTS